MRHLQMRGEANNPGFYIQSPALTVTRLLWYRCRELVRVRAVQVRAVQVCAVQVHTVQVHGVGTGVRVLWYRCTDLPQKDWSRGPTLRRLQGRPGA